MLDQMRFELGGVQRSKFFNIKTPKNMALLSNYCPQKLLFDVNYRLITPAECRRGLILYNLELTTNESNLHLKLSRLIL